jgi:hypothetical protein
MSDPALETFDAFRALPHAVTLLGMSGVGKTLLSSGLRRTAGWYHYSADYRIGTRYLAEDILDNIKAKIMAMRDPFVADLLRSDSIYINHNITVDNLDPVSTFLGMFGDPARGGLNKATFLDRQALYAAGERQSMIDVPRFIRKAWNIYRCRNFINDASGSLCEICDLDDPTDPVIAALRAETLIFHIKSGAENEAALKARAESDPKPLFYHPAFIARHLEQQPDDGGGVDPKDFARTLFPLLVEDRKPRYAAMAERFGVEIPAARLFEAASGGVAPSEDAFLRLVFDALRDAHAAGGVARGTVETYLNACRTRADARGA